MGMVDTVALPNGIISNYDYDALNRLTQLVQKPSGGSAIASYRYKLDNAGNRTHLEETLDGTTRSILWTYDDAYRLINELRYSGGLNINWNPTGTQYRTTTYEYDLAGNRESENVNGAMTEYEYDENDWITTITAPNSVTTYTYDARGNLIQTVEDPTVGADIATNYAYDGLDRLVSVSAPGVNTAYLYNHNSQRIQQTSSGIVTNYLWDEFSPYGDVVLETESDNDPIVSYVLGGAQILSQTKASSTSYFLSDGQGSTRLLTDSSGTITSTFIYSAFGELRDASDNAFTGTPATNYLYTGQQYDAATEKYSLRARYYDPGVGRFLSRDTWAYDLQNPVELNRYLYTAGNPINRYDPTGNTFMGYGMHTLRAFSNTRVGAMAIGSVVGASLGAAFGGIQATGLYYFALCGACGSDLQQWAMSTSYVDFVRSSMALGAAWGGALGGLAGSGGVGMMMSGAIGGMLGIKGMYDAMLDMFGDGNPFTPDNGIDPCNTTQLILSGATVVGSAYTVTQGRQVYLQKKYAKVPRLTPAPRDGKTMYRESLEYLKSLPRNQALRAAWFRDFAKQIHRYADWSAEEATTIDGGILFIGKIGESLLITADGSLYQGKLSAFEMVGPFQFRPNYQLLTRKD